MNFAFDAVGLLCGVKVVARFYTVQYEHMTQDVTACAFVIVPNFLGVYLWRELAKLDDIWLSYSKYKKGDIFSETQCRYYFDDEISTRVIFLDFGVVSKEAVSSPCWPQLSASCAHRSYSLTLQQLHIGYCSH